MRITWLRLLRFKPDRGGVGGTSDSGALFGIQHTGGQLRHLGLQFVGRRLLRVLAPYQAQFHDAHLVLQTKKEEQTEHTIDADQQKGRKRK